VDEEETRYLILTDVTLPPNRLCFNICMC